MVPVRLKIRPLWRADDRPTLQEVQFFQYLLAPRESGGMADALDLGSSAVRRGGSSPPSRNSIISRGYSDLARNSGRGCAQIVAEVWRFSFWNYLVLNRRQRSETTF